MQRDTIMASPSSLGTGTVSRADSHSVEEEQFFQGTGTISPSTFCSKLAIFQAWHTGLGLKYTITTEDCPFWRRDLAPDAETLPALPDLKIQGDQDEGYSAFQQFFKISYDASRPALDPFELATTAPTLWRTHNNYVVGCHIDEANMRKPVDQLLDMIFTFPGYCAHSEVPMSLPELPQYISEQVKLAKDREARVDAVVIRMASVNDEDPLLLGRFLARPEAHLYPVQYVDDNGHIALPDCIFEFGLKDTATLMNEVVLDCLCALFHRRFLGLHDRKIHALAVQDGCFTYFCASWENNIPTIKRYKRHPLNTFEDWLAFYVVLLSIRQTIKTGDLIINPTDTGLVWNRPPKRSASDSQGSDPFAKRIKGSTKAATSICAAADDGLATGGDDAAGGLLSPASFTGTTRPVETADGCTTSSPLHAPRPMRPKSAFTLLEDFDCNENVLN